MYNNVKKLFVSFKIAQNVITQTYFKRANKILYTTIFWKPLWNLKYQAKNQKIWTKICNQIILNFHKHFFYLCRKTLNGGQIKMTSRKWKRNNWKYSFWQGSFFCVLGNGGLDGKTRYECAVMSIFIHIKTDFCFHFFLCLQSYNPLTITSSLLW